MFRLEDDVIKMVEGDFGIVLPIKIEAESDEIIAPEDYFRITIYDKVNKPPIITKIYTNIVDNTIEFKLTEQESSLLKAGLTYYYDIDWYSQDAFLGNLIAKKRIKVIDKAGVVNES